jgi:uncharacterized protein
MRTIAFRFDSSKLLKHLSNSPLIFDMLGGGWACNRKCPQLTGGTIGEWTMARFEIADAQCASFASAPTAADTFFDLGMMYSIGRSVPVDFVTAHKWFNLAALRGNSEAVRLRREIADQMSAVEIAQAQRAARAWLKAS